MINKKIIIPSILGLLLIVGFLSVTVFSEFSEAALNKIKAWTGVGDETTIIVANQSTFEILEPAQKRNQYIVVTGIELKNIKNTLIALVNLSDETINFFPYNFQIDDGGEKKILGMMNGQEITDYFRNNNIYISEYITLDEEILTKRIKDKYDGKLFKLEGEEDKRVTITTPLAFKLYFTDKINNFKLIENLYYSLLLTYVIPYDKQFIDLRGKEFKPLYNQKDILSLSEKNDLFYQKIVGDSTMDLPYYLVDVRDQYLTLLRLDKVTPYLKEEYEK